MSEREWLRPGSARLRQIAAVLAVVCFACAGLVSAFGDREFRGVAALEFRGAVAPGEPAAVREAVWHEFLATQAVILTSRSTCERALAKLRRERASRGDSLRRACDDLRVERVPAARVLRIRYDHANAATAKEVVSAVVEAYVERSRQPATIVEPTQVQTPTRELGPELPSPSTMEEEMHAFALERELVGYDSAAATARLSDLTKSIADAHVHAIEVQARTTQLETAIKSGSWRAAVLANDPAINELRSKLALLEAESAPTDGSAGPSPRAADVAVLRQTLTNLIQGKLADLRAELALAKDIELKLSALLEQERGIVAQRERDAIELRQRQRALAASRALVDAEARGSAFEAASTWKIEPIDPGYIAERRCPLRVWALAASFALLGAALVLWLWTTRVRQEGVPYGS